jgi:uncharacterized protein YnzC (UPF0291/DUF896 family)
MVEQGGKGMITKETIARINYLARKKKSIGLTPQEKKEQQQLRRQYIDSIKKQIVTNLDASGIPKKKHDANCSCGRKNKH